jgi:hypothetical protein
MREGRGFVTTQAERGGGGAEEWGQQMQDAKKLERSPMIIIVEDGTMKSRTMAMGSGGSRLMEEGGGQ